MELDRVFFSKRKKGERKIAEDKVTFLAESISWCERKQGGERK